MPPSSRQTTSKAVFTNPLPTSTDDAKYRKKYKELKAKLAEIEQDNDKLTMRISRSKKSIQRLRVERSILYDRLQSTTTPTNPYSLHTVPHLSSLVDLTSASTSAPPLITAQPSYPLAIPSAHKVWLQQLDARKLALAKSGASQVGGEFGDGPDLSLTGFVDAKVDARSETSREDKQGNGNGNANANANPDKSNESGQRQEAVKDGGGVGSSSMQEIVSVKEPGTANGSAYAPAQNLAQVSTAEPDRMQVDA